MRTLLAAFTVLLFVTSGARAAVDHVLQATVTGTITFEQTVSPGKTRIKTLPLDNNRIFAALGLSKQVYGLGVFADGPVIGLSFYPKSASDVSPAKTIFAINNPTVVLNDTKLSIQSFEADDATPGSLGGIFDGFAAKVTGTARINPVPAPTITKVILSVRGHGTNPNGGTTGTSAIINLKVTTGKKFVQGP